MARVFTSETQTAFKFGTHEICFKADSALGNPYFDTELKVAFTKPDGTTTIVDGFYDGGTAYKARAYCDMTGVWKWNSVSNNAGLANRSGDFEVVPSNIKGKLRIHHNDPYQFEYDNGDWFLHIGDTGYRYVSNTEPLWKEYIDQAAASGITKIRVWFCQDRSNVQALFQYDREYLNLDYWQEIDRRLVYALDHYSKINIQLILFAEDKHEILNYANGDAISIMAIRYAQARFSSFANVSWCISNDLKLRDSAGEFAEREGQNTSNSSDLIMGIEKIGHDMFEREPWGTLITNHQARFSGYRFLDASWSSIVTLEDLGQVTGDEIQKYRKIKNMPVVIDEDRYEKWRAPQHSRYFFRRLMWASILSGGHATYGGLHTYIQFDGSLNGMYGYYDACREGKLDCGAHDFIYIHKFFKDTGVTMAEMIPDDSVVGSNPLLFKAAKSKDSKKHIVYLANPSVYEGHSPNRFAGYYSDEYADAGSDIPSVALNLDSADKFLVEWYKPVTGDWILKYEIHKEQNIIFAPAEGDWILFITALK